MAELSELFALIKLPRILDIGLAQKAVVLEVRLAQQQVIDLGILRSAICSYVLRPTPTLVWTYALSPTTAVDALDVVELESTKHFCAGVTDRKKGHKLMFLQHARGGIEDATVGAATAAARDEQQIETHSVPTKSRIASTHFSHDGAHVYVVFEDCTVAVYQYPTNFQSDAPADSNDAPIHTSLNKLRGSRVLYHRFFSGAGDANDALILVELINRKKVQVRILLLELQHTVEVSSVVLEEDYAHGVFAFDSNTNVLHEYADTTKTLKLYSVPHLQLLKTIDLGALFVAVPANQDAVSMQVPAPERLLITYAGVIYLVNTKYGAVLTQYGQEGAHAVVLQLVAPVRGNSMRSSDLLAVYLSQGHKANASECNVISVNVGLGTLNECLGKGIPVAPKGSSAAKANGKQNGKHANGDKFPLDETSFSGLADVLDDTFVEELVMLTHELNEIHMMLQRASEDKKLQQWERIVIPYLKGESWSSIRASKAANSTTTSAAKVPKNYAFQVFEVDRDRVVDYLFIHAICSLIFQIDDTGAVQFKSTFVPEHSLTYLFTHPLYPKEFTRGLLSLFEHRAEAQLDNDKSVVGALRLLRQALITCPNLLCFEISRQLTNANDDIFADAVARLTEEYSINQITATLLSILQKHSNDFNLEECIEKCLRLDCGWELMPALIDAGGLFGWSRDLIDRTIAEVKSQLKSLTLNSYVLTLTQQAMLINDANKAPSASRGSKKSRKQKKSEREQKTQPSDEIIESNRQQEQLDSILKISNTSRKNLLDDGISISKKIPAYSVEKLVL